MAASRAGIILLFVFIFYCCLSFIVGGIWYYNKNPEKPEKPDYTNNRRRNLKDPGPPKAEIIKTYSASACQTAGALNVDVRLACNDLNSLAGITWTWGVDAQSYKCQQECGGYIVTAVSSKFADLILKQTIKDRAQSGTGISQMVPVWYEGAITFTIMPIDKKGKKLLQIPISKNVNIAQDNQACSQVGVNTVPAVPGWNENKNLILVKQNSTSGASGGLSVTNPAGDEIYWSGYNGIDYLHTIAVPKGHSAAFWCDPAAQNFASFATWGLAAIEACSRVKGFSWEELVKKQDKDGIVSLFGSCFGSCPRV